MLKKSTGMQKIYIGVANHQSDFLDTFGPLGSLCDARASSQEKEM